VARPADKIGALTQALRDTSGSSIVYVNRRTDAEEVASRLRDAGVEAAHYHAAMPTDARSTAQSDWREGKTKTIVATIAFGMGIDKPDVRAVFHYQYPSSLEEYYQQVGRAGRDGQPAKCILFYDSEDKGFHRWVLDQEFPDREAAAQVYGLVRDGLGQDEILRFGGGSAATLYQSALNLLEQLNCIRRTAPGTYEVVAGSPPIHRVDLSEAERRRRQSEERIRAIEGYVEGRACRRRAILEYFGEHLPSNWNCSGCDRCRSSETEETKRTPVARQAVLDSVRELESRRMSLNQMARAILFLGKPIKGLTETDVREILHSLVREGAVDVNPQ
jgi:ATP-dependent DNA helicase RecQ